MKSILGFALAFAVTQATSSDVLISVTGPALDKPASEPVVEEITLTETQMGELKLAAWTYLRDGPSEYLGWALTDGTIETPKIEKHYIPDYESTSFSAHIRWVPYELTETRRFRPILRCFADGELNWSYCQEESWIIYQSAEMEEPIILEGDLSDRQIARIYELVDEAELVSETDGEVVTSDKIYQIINYEHTGERVNVYVKTAKEGYTDVIYVKRSSPDDDNSPYELTEFVCGNPT